MTAAIGQNDLFRLVLREVGAGTFALAVTSADAGTAGTTSGLGVTMVTGLNRFDDGVTNYESSWTPVNISASAQILSAPGRMVGFYVNSTTSGAILIADNGTSGSGYISGTIIPSVGWNQFPAELATAGFVTVAAGTINATFFVRGD